MISHSPGQGIAVLDHIEAAHLVRVLRLVGTAGPGELRHRIIRHRVQAQEIAVQRQHAFGLVEVHHRLNTFAQQGLVDRLLSFAADGLVTVQLGLGELFQHIRTQGISSRSALATHQDGQAIGSSRLLEIVECLVSPFGVRLRSIGHARAIGIARTCPSNQS